MRWFRCAVLLFSLLYGASLFAQPSPISLESFEKKSQEARKILAQERLYCYSEKKVREKKIRKRAKPVVKWQTTSCDILLAVYSPGRDAIEVVRLNAQYPYTLDARTAVLNFSVKSRGYRVQYMQGRRIPRLWFRVFKNGEELYVLDMAQYLKLTGNKEYYFPYSDLFLREDIRQAGRRYWRELILEVEKELNGRGIKSKAYPDRLLLGNVFLPEHLMILGFMEQTDDEEFAFRCPSPETLGPQNRIYSSCAEYTFSKVLVHLWRNKTRAFGLATSEDGARGGYQFMNSPRIPTYNLTLRLCPQAGIIRDYAAGTQDLANSVKAAICLLDFELSKFPVSVRELFLEDPMVGGGPPLSAFNAGGKARKWYQVVVDFLREYIPFIPKGSMPKETAGFIRKYREAWLVFDSLEEQN